MRTTWLPDVEPRPRRVAVGEFDGVHLGHREVIRGADTVLTFEPHPRTVVGGNRGAPLLLTTLEQKQEQLELLGVEELVLIPFDEAFAAQTPEAFIADVLLGALGATHVSVGDNFRFGHRARGDTELLRAQPQFETRVTALVEADGEIISSTHIRGLLAAGEVDLAAHFLGRPFELRGPVAHGDKRGRTLGYPTANLVPDPLYAIPGHGVYATLAGLPDGSWVPSATNVGVRPQFVTGRGVLVEAYLVDWSGDLYGQPLKVQFLRKLRGEKRFDDLDGLLAQMGRDVEEAAEIAQGHGR